MYFNKFKILLAGIATFIAAIIAILLLQLPEKAQPTNTNYNYAIIYREDGEQLIKIKTWKDYKNSDQIQIISEDDIVYLLHSSKVVLLSDLETQKGNKNESNIKR